MTVLSDDIPATAAWVCFVVVFIFQSENSNIDLSCCGNEEKNVAVWGFFGRFLPATETLSQGENTAFAIRSQFLGSQKSVSLQFQSCVKTNLGCTVPFYEKRYQGIPVCEC